MKNVKEETPQCNRSHKPNKETSKALDASEIDEGIISFDSVEDFFKSMKNSDLSI